MTQLMPPTAQLESYTSSFSSDPTLSGMHSGPMLYQAASFQLPGTRSGSLQEGAMQRLQRLLRMDAPLR